MEKIGLNTCKTLELEIPLSRYIANEVLKQNESRELAKDDAFL